MTAAILIAIAIGCLFFRDMYTTGLERRKARSVILAMTNVCLECGHSNDWHQEDLTFCLDRHCFCELKP